MIEKYKAQVSEWAKELGCELRLSGRLDAMMFVEHGYVCVPDINDQQTYLINLHELAHFALDHSQGRPPRQNKRRYFDIGVLKSEAQAWELALDKCIDDISDDNRKFMWDFCLGSYYWAYLYYREKQGHIGNGDRDYVEFHYDHPDVYFETVMKRICKDMPMERKYIGRWDNISVS